MHCMCTQDPSKHTMSSSIFLRCQSLRRFLQCASPPLVARSGKRFYRERKRFYKSVSLSQTGQRFEVNLDRRKVRTPAGTLLTVPSEPLAVAVATEWDSQGDTIKQHTMHLTSLCNTATDNPTSRERHQVIKSILHFLDTDTICYRVEEPPELTALQTSCWDPLLDWINARYNVDLSSSTSITGPEISEESRRTLAHHLETHSDWALIGYENAVSSLKSLVLTFALMDRRLSVEEAVNLSFLETEFQVARWGNVEWAHDTEITDIKARVAAASLFTQLLQGSHDVQQKQPAQ